MIPTGMISDVASTYRADALHSAADYRLARQCGRRSGGRRAWWWLVARSSSVTSTRVSLPTRPISHRPMGT